MEEIKKAKIWRFILRLTFFLVALVLPVVLMITHFEITKEVTETKTKVTFYGFIVLFIVFAIFWKFKGKFMAWVNTWEYSYMKYFFIGFSKIWVYVILAIAILYTKASLLAYTSEVTNKINSTINNFFSVVEYCIIVIAICESIAYLIISPLEEKFDAKVKRYIRKQERKEDYKEAIKELQEMNKEI